MAAHKTDKRNTLYANLMDEAKVRIECIGTTCQGRGAYPTVITREFCWLQLRMLCELIALSCLVAHGDIGALQSHKVGKAYSADEILDRLARLRPHFYPQAIKEIGRGPGAQVDVEVINPHPLSKEDLLSLYGKTHRYVHRRSLKRLLSMETPIDMHVNIPEIIGWAQKLNDLLSHHIIAVSDSHLIICVLRNADDNNRVQVATAEAPGPK
jgi:hypothetical protein